MKMNPVIFREYDIRGVYEEDFDLDFAFQLGQAFATFVKSRATKPLFVSIGHDARGSSPAIVGALSQGVQSCGGRVLLLGLVTSPISYFSTFHIQDLVGALMVTGSHNPPEYNGFKISVGQTTIFGEDIKSLQKIIESEKFSLSPGGSEARHDIFPDYVERYKREFGSIGHLPLVLDCGNGAAGCVVRRLYEACGLRPTILFEEPDGRFPNHHPDPTVEKNLVDLKRAVVDTGARVGIGFDGDADRIGVVDEAGRMILGDELMAIISRDILARKSGQKIIGDVKCSDRLFEDIKKSGGEPIMWKTGHSLIKQKVKEEHAPFGGELSGHVFFADKNYGYDDAPYAGLRLVEILARTGKTISQLLEGFPPAHNTPEIRIDTTEEKKHRVVEKLKSIYSKNTDRYKVNFIDGVRISFDQGWALARVSNTQPVLVLRFESSTKTGLDAIRNEIEAVVNPLL